MIGERFDVVVVGAGPAGTAAAQYAAREGARVCLLEQNSEIGCPIRTSGASFTSRLNELGVPARLFHPLHKLRLVGPTRSALFEYPEPVACVLDVRGLYQYLAAEAAATGVQIRLNRQVIGASMEPGGQWQLVARARDGEEHYCPAIVVDASGFGRIVQRRAGLQGAVERFGFGVEYDLFAPAWPQDEAVLLVGSEIAPSGYAWVFPRGSQRARAGVGIIRPDADAQPHDYLKRLATVPSIARELAGAQPLEVHVGYIPSEPTDRRFVYDGLIAAGDAAGHASPLVGEGIRYAIQAGRLAGTIAGEAIRAGDCSAKRLNRFSDAWEAEQGRFMRVAYEINVRLARHSDQMWDDRIELLKRLPADLFLKALMTEFTIGWAARALTHVPKMIGPLMRSLL